MIIQQSFSCPMRCRYHGSRDSTGTYCDSSHFGEEQRICTGESNCPIATEFYNLSREIKQLKCKATAYERTKCK